jgi:hypothetical protein
MSFRMKGSVTTGDFAATMAVVCGLPPRRIESTGGDGKLPKETATVPAPPANIDTLANIVAVRLSPRVPLSVGCDLAAGSMESVRRQPAADGPRGLPDSG